MSNLIREALYYFTKKKEHSVSTLPSFLPASTEDKYKTVSVYFPRRDWNLLEMISKNTGRYKTELLKTAVEEHLRKSL